MISIWIFAENLTDREEPISEIFPCFKENKNDKWEVFTENKRIIIFGTGIGVGIWFILGFCWIL